MSSKQIDARWQSREGQHIGSTNRWRNSRTVQNAAVQSRWKGQHQGHVGSGKAAHWPEAE